MPAEQIQPPRLRQAVVAARDLDSAATRLRESLALGEPFSDPAVAAFGLRNAVFALGETFLEIVSPVQDNTTAGRLLDRRGGDCGYMLMFQVDDLGAARDRAAANGVRVVFEVDLPDMAEVHLHPADMTGAIVSLSTPAPPASWRWGGADWEARSEPGALLGATVAVSQPDAVAARWRTIIGDLDGIRFEPDEHPRGPVEVRVQAPGAVDREFVVAGVRFVVE
jgi:predicted enzyme related to lactoylglutathione lyase